MIEKKLNILLVTDFYHPHWTGYAKSLNYFAQSMANYNNVTVLTVRHDKSLKRNEKISRIDIIREDYLLSVSRSKYSLNIILKFLQLVSKCDVVFINSPCSNILPLSAITKIFGKKLHIFHQGDLILPRNILNMLIEKIFDLSSFISFSIADRVSTYTRDYANNSRILKHYLQKFSPMVPQIGTNFNNRKVGLHKRINKNSKVLFGFAGRFVHEKGFDLLFSAIPLIKKQIPNSHFIFAGETNMGYEDFFKKNLTLFNNVKKDITILGLLNDVKLKKFYETIDFIIVPSRSDCFNLVQAEAMLSGVPSIASDIPGLRMPVKETGFGVLFKKEDPQDLTRAVIEAVRSWEQIIKKEINVKVVFDKQSTLTKLKTFFS